MSGLYYEDLDEGVWYRTPARTVTEADLVAFAALTWDTNPLHTDAEFARTTPFGRPIAHGLLGLAYATGLWAQTGLSQGVVLAFLGLEDWQFTAPILVGDTIHARQRVVHKRESSKPDRGIVTWEVEVQNQRDEVVQSGRRVVLLRRRPGNAEC